MVQKYKNRPKNTSVIVETEVMQFLMAHDVCCIFHIQTVNLCWHSNDVYNNHYGEMSLLVGIAMAGEDLEKPAFTETGQDANP